MQVTGSFDTWLSIYQSMCCVIVETHRLDTQVHLNDQQALVVGSVEWSVRGVGIMALGDMANDRYLTSGDFQV